MPPLTRQRTFESIHSWWSDSNPSGPAFPLHAAAKPFMRWMYHRQAVDFIDKNREIPLSGPTLEICASYLSYKYVSASTKLAILVELNTRVESEGDALTVLNSDVLECLAELVESSNAKTELHSAAKSLMQVLYYSRVVDFIERNRDNPLSTDTLKIYSKYLGDTYNSSSTTTAILVNLRDRARSEDQAHVLLQSAVVDSVLNLFKSPEDVIRTWVLRILESLAEHMSTATALSKRLVLILRSVYPWASSLLPFRISTTEDIQVLRYAISVLARVTRSLDGEHAAMDVKVLDYLVEILAMDEPEDDALGWRMEQLVSHHSIAAATYEKMVAVLLSKYAPPKVVEILSRALSPLATSLDGAHAVLNSETLNHLAELVQSPHTQVRKWTCQMIGNLARHDVTAMHVSGRGPCGQLVSLLRDSSVDIVGSACRALAIITGRSDGLQAAVDVKLLVYVPGLLEWPNAEIRTWTCCILENVALHPSVTDLLPAELYLKLLKQLKSILRDDSDHNVLQSAADALRDLER
ncbi:armadillo-type protein [Mycena vulgaris]|nr:armadillo-type protein [Mycena vulgaris]